MLRKATWPLLLLLLVSTQIFATACDARCGVMASMATQGEMTGMSHCPGMSSDSSSATFTGSTFLATGHCICEICKSDAPLIQKRTLYDFGATPLLKYATIAARECDAPLSAIGRCS